MKRPLLVVLIGLVLGELIAFQFYWKGILIPASLFVIFFFKAGKYKRQKPFFILIYLAFAGIIFGLFIYNMERGHIERIDGIVHEIQGGSCQISGRIVRKKIQEDETISYTMKNPRIKKGNKTYKVHGSISLLGQETKNCIEAGDLVEFEVKAKSFSHPGNPGEFDERKYNLANGIYFKCNINRMIAQKRPGFSLIRMAYFLKNKMEASYGAFLKEEDSAMLSAMVLGDKSRLTDEQRRIYEENGVAHLLAISGLHMSIVGGAIYRFLRKRAFGYGISCLGGGFVLFFYGSMTAFSNSVLRAFIMYSIYLFSEYMGMQYDLISAMSLSAILMLFEQAYRIFDGGFLISYCSILAIAFVIPLYEERFVKEEKGKGICCHLLFLKHRLMESLIIYAVTCPMIMRFYYEASPYCVFLNPLILPAMPILMADSMVGALGGIFFHNRIWRYIYLPALLLLRVYENLFQWVGALPGALFITGCPAIIEMIFLYGFEIIIFYLFYKGRARIKSLLFMVMLFLTFYMVKGSNGKNLLKIHMLDVGQGDCILVSLPNGENMLIDGGSSSRKKIYKNVMKSTLYYYGIDHLDYVLVTHMDEDHVNGIRQMLEAGYPVHYLIMGKTKDITLHSMETLKREFLELAREQDTKIMLLEKGNQMERGEVTLQCLHPMESQDYLERNDESLVIVLSYGNFSAMFTGDLGSQLEDEILQFYHEKINLLKLAHHGSKYSSSQEFLQGLQPEYAILSAGKGNRYGHPHQEVLQRLKVKKIKTYQTIEGGAIRFETNGQKEKIYYWKDK